MPIPLFLRTIEETSLSMWIRDTPSLFGYWFILTLHAIGMTMLVSASAVLDLRLLGVAPGALGAGSDERLAARKPVGDDVEEGADHGSEECGQCDGHGFALRDGEDVMYEISTGGKRS